MKSNTKQRPLLITIFTAALVLVSSTAMAATSGITAKKSTFDIASKILIDGKIVSSPRIIAYANEKASILMTDKDGSQSIRIELVARNTRMKEANDAIGINFDIQYKNGNEKMHSKPQMIVEPNQEGRINIFSDSGHAYELRVIAERQ